MQNMTSTDKPLSATETADQQEKSNHSELVKDQRANSSLQRLLDQAKDPDSEFVIENEVLQRKTRDNHGNPYTQIVLPENRRAQVTHIAHASPIGGHHGWKRTKYRILRNFFWPGISNEVRMKCRSCKGSKKQQVNIMLLPLYRLHRHLHSLSTEPLLTLLKSYPNQGRAQGIYSHTSIFQLATLMQNL